MAALLYRRKFLTLSKDWWNLHCRVRATLEACSTHGENMRDVHIHIYLTPARLVTAFGLLLTYLLDLKPLITAVCTAIRVCT